MGGVGAVGPGGDEWGRERVLATRGQTDIRGFGYRRTGYSAGSVRWSKGRAWQREPLLLIVRSRVTSTRCHSRSATAWWLLCLLLVWALGSINVPSAARPAGR